MVESSIAASMQNAFSAMGLSGCSTILCLSTFHPTSWYIYSSVSDHMTSIKSTFPHTQPFTRKGHITTANGNNMPILGTGTIVSSNHHNQPLHLSGTYYVHNLSANLISVGHLLENNNNVTFSSGCVLQDQEIGKVHGLGHRQEQLFALDINHPVVSFIATFE